VIGAAAVCALAVVLAACTGGSDDRTLTVFAAASLTDVFRRLEPAARFNFAGSDELATQLREGADADVYAAASTRDPRELAAEAIVEQPVVFATNRLVLIVPVDNPAAIEGLVDVARPGVRLVVGGEGVPVGDYTRAVLEKARRADVLARVVSEEEDVRGIVGKVALGEADAGFVYATDARAAAGDVRALPIPARFQVPIEYPVAIVRRTKNREAAEAFVARLRSQAGRRLLRAAGFGVP
jgi:molybdate transport system substrate-binding protein